MPTELITELEARFQCRHILTDGRRCGSPALRAEHFCYFHATTRVPTPRLSRARSQVTLELPPPEDRTAIQFSIGEVLRHIASGHIEPRRAGLLLYGLQIASNNLPREAAPKPNTPQAPVIEILTDDPDLGPLAPRTPVLEPESEKPITERFLKELALLHLQENNRQPPTQQPPLAEDQLPLAEASSRAYGHGFSRAITAPTDTRLQPLRYAPKQTRPSQAIQPNLNPNK